MTIRAVGQSVHVCSAGLENRRPIKALWAHGHALVRLALLAFVGALPAVALSIQPERLGQESFLTRAVYAEGCLWVLSDAGDVSSVTEGPNKRIEEVLPGKAIDLCVSKGHPVVVTSDSKGNSVWTLRQHAGNAWPVVATVRTESDDLLAMTCAAGTVVLLTTRRLVEFDGKQQNALHLSGALGRGLVSATYTTSDQFLVGLNAGEWGGGLQRIDRRTGKISHVERNASGDLCGGPLNTSCDPVNGVVAEPGKPGCLGVAVGLVHMVPHGRVVEVCGDRVERLFYKPYGEGRSLAVGKDDEPGSTVAFFGLVSDGDRMRAVGIDGIYTFEPEGDVRVMPLPQFKNVGGISVSFDMPNFVLVLTNVNQRLSVSGAVPLMVPR